ncbi:MAG: hypothetical protein HOY79_48345 [Streptomyces sp.]|nr:hypothetical protein [Streptomyces sp.]
MAYTAEVTVFALVAVLLASAALHSTPVDISTGVTAAWLAGLFLPCPCHRRAGRR